MNLQSNAHLENLLAQESEILDSILVLAKDLKRYQSGDQSSKKSKLNLAEEWISKSDKIISNIEKLANNIMIAESFKEVRSSESSPLTTRLINVSNAMNNITENMYIIINRYQNERMCAAKLVAEKRMEKLLQEKERLSKLLESRQDEIQQRNNRKNEEMLKLKEAENDKKMRIKALEAHKKFLASRNAIKALELAEENSVITNESFADESTLMENHTPTGKKRRSRSLTRKVVGSVKKTIRRSVSFVNNYLDHHHHHNE